MSRTLRLYLHIPFCVRKCSYCDFVSFAGSAETQQAYTQALCNEIRAYGSLFGDYSVASVFIGGGTPSVLEPALMEQILECLNQSFSLKGTKEKRKGLRRQKILMPETEFSVEVNPGTADLRKFKLYKKMGVNRISFGLQSANNEELKALGRIHTYEDFEDSYELAREAGFHNINVDLMQAIPGQTLAGWMRTLAVTASWGPEHISAYSLIIEEGTPFHRRAQEGTLNLPDEDTERQMYSATKDFLEDSGYHRYEISNYARPLMECRHNIGYWKRDFYLGLGLNASSMVEQVRWKNTSDLSAWLQVFSDPERALAAAQQAAANISCGISKEEKKKTDPEAAEILKEVQVLSRKEQMEEFMFLGLRMSEGIDKQEFFDIFGQDFDFTYGHVVYELKSQGFVEDRDGRVRLTDRGVDLSNRVLAEFLLDE